MSTHEEICEILSRLYTQYGPCRVVAGYQGVDGQGYMDYVFVSDDPDLDDGFDVLKADGDTQGDLEVLGAFLEGKYAPEDYSLGDGGNGVIQLSIPSGEIAVQHEDRIQMLQLCPMSRTKLDKDIVNAIAPLPQQ